MSIFVFYKWVVKPEKQEEHRQLMQEWREYVKNNPENYEKVPLKILKDEEAMKFQQNWMQFIDPTSLSMDIWNAIE